jgi:LmbE family N-acetylglucosaminyl deacetylase
MESTRILILAPHVGDGEFGAGGTSNRLASEGNQIYQAVFSLAEKSRPKDLTENTIKKELYASSEKIGIQHSHLMVFDYPVREFPSVRQAILEDMVKLRKKLDPDLVFIPNSRDTHQDHQVVFEEGFRAFKMCSILGYEMPRNNLIFTANAFVFLNEKQMQAKMEAMDCYRSLKDKSDDKVIFRKHLARVRGSQIGTKYAECFETIRWVMK